MSGAPLPVDGPWVIRVLDDLARFGADPGGGVSRPAYSSADLEARAWLEEVMAAVGLEVAVDGARNTIGRTATSSAGVPAIALGSHTDTVPNGGRYDGALGVVAAIAAAKAMLESDTSTARTNWSREPLQIKVWTVVFRGLTSECCFQIEPLLR